LARPLKHEHEKRSIVLQTRITQADKAHVEEQAAACGLSLSEYTRRRTLGHVVAPLSRAKYDPALVSEINRIGVNVNQLARSIHLDDQRFVPYWQEIGSQLEEILDRLAGDDTEAA